MASAHKVIIYAAVVAGAVLLYMFFQLNALYLFIFLVSATIYFIAKNNKESYENKRFLIAIILLIFISRFILSLFVMNARAGRLSQDEGLYSKKALMKTYAMKGARDLEKPFYDHFGDYDMLIKDYGYNAYTNLLAYFYYLFGYQIQAARLINIYINVVIFLFVFYIAKKMFDSRVAKISSTIFAFFPSLTLWSTMIGIDMVTLLCISAYIFSLLKFLEGSNLKWILLMATAILALNSIKGHIAAALILITAVILISKTMGALTRKGRLAFTISALLGIFILLRSPLMDAAGQRLRQCVYTLIEHQKNFASIDDSGYLIYPAYCYQGIECGIIDFFKAYLKGLSYAIFSPFPWKIESKLQLMAYPQVILWYFMLPFILYGFYVGFRLNKLQTFAIFLYAFFLFSMFALVEGNVGAIFRHRDMVTPFLLIYFGSGINKFLSKTH